MKLKVFYLSMMAVMSLLMLDLQAQATYQVGQVYEIDGVKGMVYKTTKNGRHGMMMSLEVLDKAQFLKDKKLSTTLCSPDTLNGMENMKAIEKLIADKNLSWDVFPMFKWAKDLGEGWYIPSLYETVELLEALSGGTFENGKMPAVKNNVKEITKVLEENDGDPFSLTMVCSNDFIVKNRKGKEYGFLYYFGPQVSQSSGIGGLIGIAIDASNAAKDKYIIRFYQGKKTSKYKKGARAIRAF